MCLVLSLSKMFGGSPAAGWRLNSFRSVSSALSHLCCLFTPSQHPLNGKQEGWGEGVVPEREESPLQAFGKSFWGVEMDSYLLCCEE